MTEEELRQKCKERAKIFQQAMESCKSSSPMDCIEWFADRIAELEKENAELKSDNEARKFAMAMSEKVEKQLREENAELKTDYKVLSCSVGDFGELQEKLEEEQRKNNGLSDNLTKAKEIISEWEDSFCCGADYLYLGNKGRELRIKSQNFLNNKVEK